MENKEFFDNAPQKKHPLLGLKRGPMSEEHKRKIGLANKGRVFTSEHRRKLGLVNKGKKHGPISEEHKNRISLANTGRVRTEEWKRKLSEARRGKTNSEAQKEKQRIALKNRWANGFQGMKGYQWSPEQIKAMQARLHTPEALKKSKETRLRNGYRHPIATLKKLSAANRGENNPRWRGGITPTRERIRHSLEYRLWREAVFKRDDFTCKMPGCGIRGGRLNANHIKKFADFPELRFDVRNGIALCEPCHKKIMWREAEFEPLFISVLANQPTQPGMK